MISPQNPEAIIVTILIAIIVFLVFPGLIRA